MLFSSITFIFFFLPIVLLSYFIAEKTGNIKIKNGVILLFSLLFYSWGGLQSLITLLILICINYVCGIIIACRRHCKIALVAGLVIDISVLIFYKYLGFITQNIVVLIGSIRKTTIEWKAPEVALLLGISFFTFQMISYLVDVYRGNAQVQRNIFQLSLYVLMFPRITQGPIVRYSDVEKEIIERHTTAEMAEIGIKRFILGLSKKVFIATSMGNVADAAFAINGNLNPVYAWLGAICYTLQIYYDFSGYSDMAIGLGKIFGFTIPENFNYPYISTSIKDFWRRWHISLSLWFRDYVYIPLGGNRKGSIRTYINLSVVFLLTGIWHGAAWQFIFWGVYHGVFMLIERIGFSKILERLPKILQRLYAIIIVTIGWVFFRADSLRAAIQYIKNMFSYHAINISELSIAQNMGTLFWVMLVLALFFSAPVFPTLCKRLDGRFVAKVLGSIGYLILFAASVIYLSGLTYNPFIYFKF